MSAFYFTLQAFPRLSASMTQYTTSKYSNFLLALCSLLSLSFSSQIAFERIVGSSLAVTFWCTCAVLVMVHLMCLFLIPSDRKAEFLLILCEPLHCTCTSYSFDGERAFWSCFFVFFICTVTQWNRLSALQHTLLDCDWISLAPLPLRLIFKLAAAAAAT